MSPASVWKTCFSYADFGVSSFFVMYSLSCKTCSRNRCSLRSRNRSSDSNWNIEQGKWAQKCTDRRVSGRPDAVFVRRSAQVFDVVEDHIGRLAFELLVLAASDGRYVRRDAGVHDDVVFTPVLPHRQATEHFEAMAKMELSRNAPQNGMERWQGKCLLADVAQWPLQRCNRPCQLRLLLKKARELTVHLKSPRALSTSATCCFDSA